MVTREALLSNKYFYFRVVLCSHCTIKECRAEVSMGNALNYQNGYTEEHLLFQEKSFWDEKEQGV